MRAELRKIKCTLPSDMQAMLAKPYWRGLPEDLLERDPLDCLGYEDLMEQEENFRRRFVDLTAKELAKLRRREKTIENIARQSVLVALKDNLELTILVIRARRMLLKWINCGAKIYAASTTGGGMKLGKVHVPDKFLQLEANRFIKMSPDMGWRRVLQKVASKFTDRNGKPLSVRNVGNHTKDPRQKN